MQKIPTIFKLDYRSGKRVVTDEPNIDECPWMFDGSCFISATRKFDGYCCMITGSTLFKRYTLKAENLAPEDFISVEKDTKTGNIYGWVRVNFKDPSNKHHVAAFKNLCNNVSGYLPNGTCELCGPKIHGNPEGFVNNLLIFHATAETYEDVPLTFNELKEWMFTKNIRGIVFHNSNGLMAKIKEVDFKNSDLQQNMPRLDAVGFK